MKRENIALSKVMRPRLQLTYQRRELFRLLDELSTTPLTMINGLPGSGKTTLLSSYIESRSIPCLWYQIDRDDEDLARFFYYLGISALKLNSYNKIALPQLSTEQHFNVSFQVKEYFQRLYICLEKPFMIVFDNYHKLPEDAALHEVTAHACAALPRGGRIVLINNSDCRKNRLNFRGHRTIATLCGEDLLLSQEEVKEIAALHGVRLVSDQIAKQLQSKFGNWVQGLIQELQGECLPHKESAEARTI